MPTIVSTTLAITSSNSVTATTIINWAPAEIGINYLLRYDFWEQDDWWRGEDDRLRYVIDRALAAPHPSPETDAVVISSHPSWNNEWGRDEIYARVNVFPDPRFVTTPGIASGATNVVAARW